MKTVKLINGDFTNSEATWIKNVIKVGDNIPIEGMVYEVESEFWDYEGPNNTARIVGYELVGLDTEFYKPYLKEEEIASFKAERFEVVDDAFKINAVTSCGTPCMETNIM